MLQKGKTDTFELLFRTYYTSLFLYAKYFTPLEEEAKDTVQDVFLNFWNKKAYQSIKDDKALKTYLYRSIKNTSLNKIRKRKLVELEIDQLTNEIIEEETQNYDENILQEILQEIHKLPQQIKEVVISVLINKKRYKEVADDMEISVNTVKSYLRVGIKSLREKFAKKVDLFLLIINSNKK